MSKSKRFRKIIQQRNQLPVTDRTLWYSDLSSLDPKKKNEVWAAQSLFYMKRGGAKLFQDPAKAIKYRQLDQLVSDPAQWKEMIDPKTPMGGGGEAKYFSSDFKLNPIYLHLKNIIAAEIEKTGKSIEINLTDKYAKTRRMQENYRVIYRNAFRDLINRLASQIGIPGISKHQDPYKWAQNFMSKKDDVEKAPDTINNFVDLIRNEITDDKDMALYNEYIYKCDYEYAFELGVQYYLMKLNKWNVRFAQEFISDIMHFNKASGEWYTDLMTGRPKVRRFVPEDLYVSNFKQKDGEDIMYYFYEERVTFAEFMRTAGKNLSVDRLKSVFELMKLYGVHNHDWREEYGNIHDTIYTRDNAQVLLGRAAFLSTDMEVQMEDPTTGFSMPVDITWAPLEGSGAKRVEKRYNVWRWWYYLPPVASDTKMNANWHWQSQYIFELSKFQDQQRYGDEGRYAKSPLVIYDNSSQASYTDIVMDFMPKITHAWHKYQNCLVNDINATILSDDFISGVLGAVDEDNKIATPSSKKDTGGNGRDAFMEQWKMIKQSGKGFLKMRDRNGQPLMDPSKLVVSIKNNMLDDAEKYMTQMLMLYDMMIKSLAFSPMTAGEEVKPRTPVAALEQSLKATESSRFFIQKGYEEFLIMYAERIVRYIIDIAREKDAYDFPYRWEEFMDNVGYANSLAIEGMADIDPEVVGMSVNLVDGQAKKDFIMTLAVEAVKRKDLSEEFLYLLMGVDNWKYAFVLMRIAIKNKAKENQAMEERAHERAMELRQADIQLMAQMEKLKTAGKDQNIITEGKVEEMVNASLNRAKMESQAMLKNQTDTLRRGENEQTAELKKEEETHKKNLEQQASVISSLGATS